MTKRNFLVSILAIIALFSVACAGAGPAAPDSAAPEVSASEVSAPESTEPESTASEASAPDATAPEAKAEEPAATGPTAKDPAAPSSPDKAQPASDAAAAAAMNKPPVEAQAPLTESDVLAAAPSLSELDLSALTSEIVGSPDLMGCTGGKLGMSTLMELLARPPTETEYTQMLPCFSTEQLLKWSGKDPAQAATEPTSSPTSPVASVASDPKGPPPVWETRSTALDAPAEGAWYDGSLFDAHMHMSGVTFDYQGRYTTDDVLHSMDRHNIQASVGFWLPPLTGRHRRQRPCWTQSGKRTTAWLIY